MYLYSIFIQNFEKPLSPNARRSFSFSSLRIKSKAENHVTPIYSDLKRLETILFKWTYVNVNFLQEGTVKRLDLHGGEGCCLFHQSERHRERVNDKNFSYYHTSATVTTVIIAMLKTTIWSQLLMSFLIFLLHFNPRVSPRWRWGDENRYVTA